MFFYGLTVWTTPVYLIYFRVVSVLMYLSGDWGKEKHLQCCFPLVSWPSVSETAEIQYRETSSSSQGLRWSNGTVSLLLWVCGCVCVCCVTERERERENLPLCCSAALQPHCGYEPPGGAPPEGLQVGQSISGPEGEVLQGEKVQLWPIRNRGIRINAIH